MVGEGTQLSLQPRPLLRGSTRVWRKTQKPKRKQEVIMSTKPVKVYNWPMGYCEREGHFGEHPLYTSSDGGCRNFELSERLLEIKQMFDDKATIAHLSAVIEEARVEAQDHFQWCEDHDMELTREMNRTSDLLAILA